MKKVNSRLKHKHSVNGRYGVSPGSEMCSGTQTLVWAGTCELLIILGVPLYIV